MWTQRQMEKHYLQLLLNIFRELEFLGGSREPETVKVLGRSRNALESKWAGLAKQVGYSSSSWPWTRPLLSLLRPFESFLIWTSVLYALSFPFFLFKSAYSSSVIWFHWRKWQAFIKCPLYVPVTVQVPQVKLQPKGLGTTKTGRVRADMSEEVPLKLRWGGWVTENKSGQWEAHTLFWITWNCERVKRNLAHFREPGSHGKLSISAGMCVVVRNEEAKNRSWRASNGCSRSLDFVLWQHRLPTGVLSKWNCRIR